MIVYNNQRQLTRLCSFQEDFVLLQSPLRNNGNQGQHAIIPCNSMVMRSIVTAVTFDLPRRDQNSVFRYITVNNKALKITKMYLIMMLNNTNKECIHSCDSTDIFMRWKMNMRWKMKCYIQLDFASLNRTFHLSPHDNIFDHLTHTHSSFVNYMYHDPYHIHYHYCRMLKLQKRKFG